MTTPPNTTPDRDPVERLTFVAVVGVLVMVPLLTFLFSFGNVWSLARRLHVPTYVQPLVAPAVDLSVAGLFIALAYLSLRGVPKTDLRPARHLLHLSGLVTLALNCAEALAEGKYGRAAFDSVGPMLLIGWGAVGPLLLRQVLLTTQTAPDASVAASKGARASTSDRVAGGASGTSRRARTGTGTGARTGTGTRRAESTRKRRTDGELAALLDQVPRDPDGTVPVRRAASALGCGADRARRLLDAAGLRTPPVPLTVVSGGAS